MEGAGRVSETVLLTRPYLSVDTTTWQCSNVTRSLSAEYSHAAKHSAANYLSLHGDMAINSNRGQENKAVRITALSENKRYDDQN